MYLTERVTYTVEPLEGGISADFVAWVMLVSMLLMLIGIVATMIANLKRGSDKTLLITASLSGLGILGLISSVALEAQYDKKAERWHTEVSRTTGEMFLTSDLEEAGLLQAMQAEEASTLTIPTAPQEGGKDVKVNVDGWALSYDAPPTEGRTLSKEAQLVQIGETACRTEEGELTDRLARMCTYLKKSTGASDAPL